MPDSSYPEGAEDPDIREGHIWKPSPLCVPETLRGSVWMVVLRTSVLEDINRYSMTNGPTRMEPHEAGVFVCFVHCCGFSSQNRTVAGVQQRIKDQMGSGNMRSNKIQTVLSCRTF